MRYWDGYAWTGYTAPTPPAAPMVMMNNVVPVVQHSGPNHVLHLLLTVFTCGWWLPIWLIVAIADSFTARPRPMVTGSVWPYQQRPPIAPVVPPTPRSTSAGFRIGPVQQSSPKRGFAGFASTDAGAATIAIVVAIGFFGIMTESVVAALIVAIVAVVVGTAFLAVQATKARRQYLAQRQQYDAEVAARADMEHQAMMRGDLDAGVFGAFQPDHSAQAPLVGADEMRQSAWQPDLSTQMPVRPANPAPWHVVTQWPTRQFQQVTPDDDGGRPDALS
jgi:hypothetical protein